MRQIKKLFLYLTNLLLCSPKLIVNMFLFNIKSFFHEAIYAIFILLSIIYIITSITSYLVKWIHPYLKNCLEMCCDEDISVQYEEVSRKSKRCDRKNFKNKKEGKKEDTGTENLSSEQASRKYKASSFKTIQSENKSLKNGKESMNKLTKTRGFYDNAVSVNGDSNSYSSFCESLLRNSRQLESAPVEIGNSKEIRALLIKSITYDRKCSEAQTNITISPRLIVEYTTSSPNLVFTCGSVSASSFHMLEQLSDSSEEASSDCSVSNVKLVPTGHHLGCCEILSKNKNILDSIVERVKRREQVDKVLLKDNKLLEMAICKFEKELMPIKHQIKELKEYFYEVKGSNPNKSSSSMNNASLSSSCSESQSECLSLTTSTICSVFPSSALTSKITVSSLIADTSQGNNPQNLDSDEFVKSKDIHITIPTVLPYTKRSHPDKKHSPLAEMYIKLSQSDLMSPVSCTHATRQKGKHGKKPGLTYEINLNVNVGGTGRSTRIKRTGHQSGGCDIVPVLSEPEDILYEQLHTCG